LQNKFLIYGFLSDLYSIEKYEKTGLWVLSRFKLESEPEKERKIPAGTIGLITK
jgi:hypothetical protein